MKKIFYFFILGFIVVILTGCSNNHLKNNKINIMATNFPCYDFMRAIVKDVPDVSVQMLLTPGTESHSFEPTPRDIINIKNSDMFIYVGGESDEWIRDILEDIKTDSKAIRLMDLVDTVTEERVEGMEYIDEEIEYDEHVWTSPVNVIEIVSKLKDSMIEIDYDNKELYEENVREYINKLSNIDEEIRNIVNNAERKELIFGDRFPLRYFTDEYNLKYYAAFPGCFEDTEASAKTISFLIQKVKENKIPVVLRIELSNNNIANTISKETGAKVLEFNSAHNISKEEFESGVTYVDIMKNNIKVLKEALN